MKREEPLTTDYFKLEANPGADTPGSPD